eukprot:957666-Prymnesium_polylepis.3
MDRRQKGDRHADLHLGAAVVHLAAIPAGPSRHPQYLAAIAISAVVALFDHQLTSTVFGCQIIRCLRQQWRLAWSAAIDTSQPRTPPGLFPLLRGLLLHRLLQFLIRPLDRGTALRCIPPQLRRERRKNGGEDHANAKPLRKSGRNTMRHDGTNPCPRPRSPSSPIRLIPASR